MNEKETSLDMDKNNRKKRKWKWKMNIIQWELLERRENGNEKWIRQGLNVQIEEKMEMKNESDMDRTYKRKRKNLQKKDQVWIERKERRKNEIETESDMDRTHRKTGK